MRYGAEHSSIAALLCLIEFHAESHGLRQGEGPLVYLEGLNTESDSVSAGLVQVEQCRSQLC